jgi:hypothetical protein
MTGMNWDRAKARDAVRRDNDAPITAGRRGHLPATPKQLALLRRIGVEHGSGLNRLQASALIREHKPVAHIVKGTDRRV